MLWPWGIAGPVSALFVISAWQAEHSCWSSLQYSVCVAVLPLQIIAYLAGLHYSGMWRPALVVAPATVLRQWMAELRSWYPPIRVILLHDSGRSPMGSSRPDRQGEGQARLAGLAELLAPHLGHVQVIASALAMFRDRISCFSWSGTCFVIAEVSPVHGLSQRLLCSCQPLLEAPDGNTAGGQAQSWRLLT